MTDHKKRWSVLPLVFGVSVCTLLLQMEHIGRHGVTPREFEVCLGETSSGRLLKVVVMERKGRIAVHYGAMT